MRRLVALALTVCLAAAVPAFGSHRPSQRARAELNAAVRRSHLMPPPIRHGHFHLRGARVSSHGPWSKATVVPVGRLRHRLDSALAIFRRHGRGWRVVDVGTAEVGCYNPRLPTRVRRDLGLRCPPARAGAARESSARSGTAPRST